MASIRGLIAASLLVLAMGHAQAREAPLTDAEREVVQVFEVPGYTKDQIYTLAHRWIAENFVSAKSVLEYEDREGGVLIGNAGTMFTCEGGWVCRQKAKTWVVAFKIKIEAKDDRLRLSFTDVHLDGRALGCCVMPIKTRDDMANVRRTLLEMGDRMLASMKSESNESW